MNALLAGSLVDSLVKSPVIAALMASEAAALLAGEPVAFFAGKATDSVEPFVMGLLEKGFGTGEEAAEVEVLQKLLQERPIRPEQLLSEGSTAHRLTNLAALSDSLDYLAEAIVQFGKHALLVGSPNFVGTKLCDAQLSAL
eukprot:jgi/Astpho2/1517/Aster-x0065